MRDVRGTTAFYPLTENRHEAGILRSSVAPAPDVDALQPHAEDIATRLLDHLHYVGVMTVEFFEVDGRLLVNEVAMRVHNSGHWTIEAAPASQFENHLRAICGWPLGLTHALGHAAMLNLIGHVPSRPSLLAIPGVHVHLYGKDGRPNRKVGHVTATAGTAAELHQRLRELEARVGALS